MTRLNQYELGECIDRGGMGEVFRARDTRLMRPVAIKFLRSEAVRDDPTVARRFLREARAASALNHPNIVIIHEVGETEDGEPFIVQEFIEGQTLRSLPAEDRETGRIADIGHQVARALAAAHAVGLTHRDVKPDNIMVRADGLVKVVDFGLARLADSGETADDPHRFETEAGDILGTPAYMSPEHAGAEDVGPASDIFSLGIVLYELIAGRQPFTGPTPLTTIAAVLTAFPPPLASFRPDAPRALTELVHRMLEKPPERRPSAEEVDRVLASIAGGGAPEPAPLAAIPGSAPVTVGRERERERLLRCYATARDAGGRIVALAGEPGIGKSNLIDGFVADVRTHGEPPLVLRGHCSESLAGSEAYLPVLEALDGLRKDTAGDSFEPVIRDVAPNWYAQITTDPAAPADDDAEASPASPERMKREFAALLEEASRRRPIVLVIEDLHWADVSTIDMLNYLATRFAEMRVMVLTGYRPSDMALVRHPFLGIRADLQARGILEEIPLGLLQPEDVAAYLQLRFPGHALPEDLATVIHGRTDGSPLFMADLVRYLRDTGGIVAANGQWELAGDLPVSPDNLPATVRAMIARKIERVDADDRPLLDAACVQGREFDSTTIGEAIGMDAIEVEDRLDRLERVHVLVRHTEEAEFPHGTFTLRYQFVHVLYQNTLFDELRPTRRVTLSRAIAGTLAKHYGSEASAVAGRLAILFEGARDFATGAQFFLLAAQRAVGLFGYSEALSLAERGLKGLTSLPDGPERRQMELGLQMIRGHALRSVKGWAAPELERTFARARELCHELNDPPELFPVLWNLAFFQMIRGDLAKARDQAAALMVQAEAFGNPAFLMSVHHVAGVTCEFLGELVESSRLLERARELHVPEKHADYTAMFGIDPGMIARAMSARPLWSLGYPDRAIERSRETIALARSQQQPVTHVFALVVAQGVHLYRGEAEASIALGDEVIALCREYEFPQEAEWAKSFQGGALAVQGRTDLGIARLQESLDALKALESGLVRTMFLSLLADAAVRAGKVELGLAAVAEGFEHAERTLEGGFVGELHRTKGQLLHMAGDLEDAEASLREALAYTRGQQARSLELRAASALARMLVEAGRRKEAHAELAPVLGWFTEGHSTADLKDAASLITQIGRD